MGPDPMAEDPPSPPSVVERLAGGSPAGAEARPAPPPAAKAAPSAAPVAKPPVWSGLSRATAPPRPMSSQWGGGWSSRVRKGRWLHHFQQGGGLVTVAVHDAVGRLFRLARLAGGQGGRRTVQPAGLAGRLRGGGEARRRRRRPHQPCEPLPHLQPPQADPAPTVPHGATKAEGVCSGPGTAAGFVMQNC